jgi:multiple antibiotic resistance protein
MTCLVGRERRGRAGDGKPQGIFAGTERGNAAGMEHFSFVFTILFVLLGPIKLIPAFAAITRDADEAFRKTLAIRGTLIAAVVMAGVALAGSGLVAKYRISLDALRIAGGLVLLLAALGAILSPPPPLAAVRPNTPPAQLAVSPLTIPIIVPPAGIAAILIFVTLASESPGTYPGLFQAVAIALSVIVVLDFLVMFFNSSITRVPGLLLFLQAAGAVLVFIQVALAVEIILAGLHHLGAL